MSCAQDIDGEEREAYTVTSVTASETPGKTRITIAEGKERTGSCELYFFFCNDGLMLLQGPRIEFQTGATVVLRELKVCKKEICFFVLFFFF